jgi:oxysterol-binding protein-related protein 8
MTALTLTACSDGDTPEKQTGQVLAIYPILPGQKDGHPNQIPPRAAPSGSTSQPSQAQQQQGDLIDTSDNTTKPQPSQTAAPPAKEANGSGKQTGEIERMLQATGQPAESGPLIDFHSDMKHDLPKIKRSDTQASHDVFVDAPE